MSKSTLEIAGDITVAWINALALVESANSASHDSKNSLLNKEQIADFYRTIFENFQQK